MPAFKTFLNDQPGTSDDIQNLKTFINQTSDTVILSPELEAMCLRFQSYAEYFGFGNFPLPTDQVEKWDPLFSNFIDTQLATDYISSYTGAGWVQNIDGAYAIGKFLGVAFDAGHISSVLEKGNGSEIAGLVFYPAYEKYYDSDGESYLTPTFYFIAVDSLGRAILDVGCHGNPAIIWQSGQDVKVKLPSTDAEKYHLVDWMLALNGILIHDLYVPVDARPYTLGGGYFFSVSTIQNIIETADVDILVLEMGINIDTAVILISGATAGEGGTSYTRATDYGDKATNSTSDDLDKAYRSYMDFLTKVTLSIHDGDGFYSNIGWEDMREFGASGGKLGSSETSVQVGIWATLGIAAGATYGGLIGMFIPGGVLAGLWSGGVVGASVGANVGYSIGGYIVYKTSGRTSVGIGLGLGPKMMGIPLSQWPGAGGGSGTKKPKIVP